MTAEAGAGVPADAIELQRRIAAPPDVVFPFLVDPQRYLQWQGVAADLDPRPGGAFRITMNDDGDVAAGSYVEIDPPRRLVLTWGWEGRDALPPGASTVTIDLTPDGDGTLLRLRHSGLHSDFAKEIHSFGWNEGIEKLAALLG